jgi:hypothetical protein
MKKIAQALWNEPVLAATVLNSVVAAVAAEGILSGWVAVVVIAISGPVVRYYTVPERKVSREPDELI